MKKNGLRKRVFSLGVAFATMFTTIPVSESITVYAEEEKSDTNAVKAEENNDGGYTLTNDYFKVSTGKYGQITGIYIVGDKYPTNYVMNAINAPAQGNSPTHQWMGELMLNTKLGNENYVESMTSQSDSDRKIELKDNKIVVTYSGNATETKGIKGFELQETYSLVNNQLQWDISIKNTNDDTLTVGDLGLPITFNEYWSQGDEIYETRVVDHSFVGKDSSYIYATRPSGQGQFLLMTPVASTGAGFEYQDHWRVEEHAANEKSWCQDQDGWSSGLNVYYIHSDVIKRTNRGYLDNTTLSLKAGESKTYSFKFTPVKDEKDMKSVLYDENIVDAVAVPGMTFSKNMPAKMYLHTDYSASDIKVSVKCPHELNLFDDNKLSVSNNLECNKTEDNTYAKYLTTRKIDGEKYHIYELSFGDLGQNDVVISYDNGKKETEYQFYIMDDVSTALNTHSTFMVNNTQWDAPGKLYDKVFDDWMMDTKSKRGSFDGYWGWGDDWGLTHGEYIAEKNVYIPVAEEIKALDEYLDTAIWNGLMQEHQEDYLIHDFLMKEPNDTPTYRGYAYAHIYNTYYSMYKIASKYPNLVNYIEDSDTYLLRAYNIMKSLYNDGVGYNWETGIMGELTTPDIIESLKKEGYTDEAAKIEDIMQKKYKNFSSTKYPYGSEYSYDNTGEEAVYTLAKLNLENDTANALSMMEKIDLKTRACRGLQPVWYHYANPTTICGESWWNFQYTAALAGYCMDDYLRLENNGKNSEEAAEAERVNYAAKLANLTCINSGQIDSDPANIGTVAWTYQSEMGNLGGQGTGGGKIHNGWRQMAGEADLGLFGALQILSADVVTDPVFGLLGYGCDVETNDKEYKVKPLDGLNTRLNILDEAFYIELDRDQYINAVVEKDCTGVKLDIKNLERSEHNTTINVSGLSDGSYSILVDGKEKGTFKAEKNSTVEVSVPLSKKENCQVEFRSGASNKNSAPVVSAGSDIETYLPKVEGIESATMAIDFELTDSQDNGARLFEFGDLNDNYLYVSFKGGKQISLTATDMKSGKTATVDTDFSVAPNYNKKLIMTNDKGKIKLYLDGDKIAELDSGFIFGEMGDIQKNYLGRSHEESIGFLKGNISNFEMYSYAMNEDEISELFGEIADKKILSTKDVAVVTKINVAPVLPGVVTALYSDGVYRNVDVNWNSVSEEQYATKSVFSVEGTIKDSDIKAHANVVVVDGNEVNLASYAKASAIIDSPQDLGGVAGLNDGFDPKASNDTSHGVWHNWLGGAQSAPAWVMYTWDDEVILTGQDAYYFKDNGGNFAPASVKIEYKDGNDWKEFEGVEGLGTELNQYNKTTFNPVQTSAIRMTMNPAALGCGVIEWKVYGFKDGATDKSALNSAIEKAEAIDKFFVKSGYDNLMSVLSDAKNVASKMGVSQKEIDEMTSTLNGAINALDMDENYALKAHVSTSYVSGWETLGAVNDGISSDSSMNKPAAGAYGSWGNTSEYETITYTWDEKVPLSKSALYLWKDNESAEVVGIQFPKKYTISYKDGDEWKEVEEASGFGLEADTYNVTTFKPVLTDGLRITLYKKEANNSGVGVIEWAVLGGDVIEEETDDDKDLMKKEKSKEEKKKKDLDEEIQDGIKESDEKEAEDESLEKKEEDISESTDSKDKTNTEDNKVEPIKDNESKSEESKDAEKEIIEEPVEPIEKETVEVDNIITNAQIENDVQAKGVIMGVQAKTRLRGEVVDDGYPNLSLSYSWTVKSKPEGAMVVFDKPNQAITDVAFDTTGTYILTLSVSDGELSSSDDVKVKVKDDKDIPKLLARYDFSESSIDSERRKLDDVTGTGYDSRFSYNPNPVFVHEEGKNFVAMSGGFSGYVRLSEELTQGMVAKSEVKEPIFNPFNTNRGGANSKKNYYYVVKKINTKYEEFDDSKKKTNTGGGNSSSNASNDDVSGANVPVRSSGNKNILEKIVDFQNTSIEKLNTKNNEAPTVNSNKSKIKTSTKAIDGDESNNEDAIVEDNIVANNEETISNDVEDKTIEAENVPTYADESDNSSGLPIIPIVIVLAVIGLGTLLLVYKNRYKKM